MKNVHLLPTHKPSRFFNNNIGEYHFREHYVPDTIQTCKNHNIYITNDEEIKGGDWFLRDDRVEKSLGELRAREWHKKIILTTDQELIQDGVQPIDDGFLNWFIHNQSCQEVEIAKGYRGVNEFHYKIIILKEETKSHL